MVVSGNYGNRKNAYFLSGVMANASVFTAYLLLFT